MVLGIPGKIGIVLISVQAVDGSQVPISAMHIAKGTDNTVMSVVVGLFLCFPFLFMYGGQGELQAGSVITATVIGNIDIDVQ